MTFSFKETLDKMMAGEIDPPPIEKTIGMRLVSYSEGYAKFKMKAEKRHHNPMGTMHGGIMCDILDAAMGLAFATTLTDGETFTTINLQINFFKQIKESDLIAEAHVVRRGKSTGYLESQLKDPEGKLVASAQSTCMVIKLND